MLKRILFSIFTISTLLFFNSCEKEEAKEHRKFNLDLNDFVLFPQGSEWTYIKPHEDFDSIEVDRITLLEVKEQYVQSEFGDYFVMKREDIFFSTRDSMLYSRITEEVQIDVGGELTEVFRSQDPNFIYYADVQIPGFRYPDITVDGPNLNFPNHYWYGGVINLISPQTYTNIVDLIELPDLLGLLFQLSNKFTEIPPGKRITNGIIYEYEGFPVFQNLPKYGHKELYLAKGTGPIVKVNRNLQEIWVLTDFKIPSE